MKCKNIILLIVFSIVHNYSFGQSVEYSSSKYDYTIDVPISFTQSKPNSLNGDLLFHEKNGTSINMVVIKRDFRTNSPHELSAQIFYNIFRNVDPNIKIFDTEKLTINDKKVFKHVRTLKFPANPNKLNQVCFTYYNGNLQYVLTLTCATNLYRNYNDLFNKVGRSIKFE